MNPKVEECLFPISIVSEQVVLGKLMSEDGCYTHFIRELKSSDFFYTVHKELFNYIRNYISMGSAFYSFDLIRAMTKQQKDGHVMHLAKYIIYLIKYANNFHKADHYFNDLIVRGKERKRLLKNKHQNARRFQARIKQRKERLNNSNWREKLWKLYGENAKRLVQ